MSLKDIERRIERLEQRTKEHGECDGCNCTAARRMLIEVNDGRSISRDWSSTDLACCPSCGDPNPRMSIKFVREIMADTAGEDS